jgi:hypothetical protein
VHAAKSHCREHQVVFSGLEVLRLMGERMQGRSDVDREDVDVVLRFMQEVTHRCLENTEHILRTASLDKNLANLLRARNAFEELNGASGTDQFALACRLYAELVADSIFDDRRCVSSLDCDAATLAQFYEWEREIDELAREYCQTIHRLETKYMTPHCI